MIHFKPNNFYLFSFIIFASFIHTHLLSLPGCSRKCGNVIIISTFSLNIFTDRHSHIIRPILALIVVAPLLATAWIAWTDREKKLQNLRDQHFDQNGGNLLRRKLSKRRNAPPHLALFTVQQMKSITNNYNAAGDRVLSCCTQAFYRGSLSSSDGGGGGGEVAVVMIKRVPRSQTNRFLDQLIYLSHPQKRETNLVRLIGCCLETHSPLLVYELHGDGGTTLSDCTRDRARASRFSCEKRVKAAAAVARGFASFTKFMHGNICSANIVMDGSFNAKIFYAAGSDHEDNDVYRDPEFARSGRLNKKSDVYSFGVVLVELLTGRGDDGGMVPEFVHSGRADQLAEILDPEMVDDEYVEVVREVAALALRCLNVKPSNRPNIKEVETKLSMLLDAITKGFHKVI